MLPLPRLLLLFTATSLTAHNLAMAVGQEHPIFYHFQGDIDPPIAECVQRAMDLISKASCVSFERSVNEQNEEDGEVLLFKKIDDPMRCEWERRTPGNGSSTVSLGSTCGAELITCARLIVRALGVKTAEQTTDTHSILYEGSRENTHSFDALREYFQRQAHRSSGNLLSHRDKHALDKQFNCSAHCKSLKCGHGGRLGSNCKCMCTYGFAGNQCDKLAKSSIFNAPSCGIRKAKEPGTITSQNYPQRYPTGEFCQWLIEAPHPWQKIAFRIESLDLDYDETLPTEDCPDTLHIFAYGTDLATKPLPCKSEETAKLVAKEFETQQNWLLVEWRSNIWNSEHDNRGFNISYRVVGEQPLQNDEKQKVVSDVSEGLKALLRDDATELQCYSCAYGTCNSTNKENWTKKSCPRKHACAHSKTAAGEASWRGCMNVDVCVQHLNSCSVENVKYPCSVCCAESLCNTASSHWQSMLLVVHIALFVLLM